MSREEVFVMSKILSYALSIAAISSVFIFAPKASALSSQQLIELTNQQRLDAGFEELKNSSTLQKSANLKAAHMCKNHYWSHDAPDGSTPWTFIKIAGYDYVAAGENLAADFNTDAGVIKGWMNSPGHKANLLSSKYDDIGIAISTCNLTGTVTQVVVAHYGALKQVSQPQNNKVVSDAAVQVVENEGLVQSASSTPDISKQDQTILETKRARIVKLFTDLLVLYQPWRSLGFS